MEGYLLVDGYNVINYWPELIKLKDINLEHARERLVEILSDYSGFKGINVIIVFDAHLVKGGVEKYEEKSGVKIIYSGEGTIADLVIEKLMNDIPKDARVYVATSDKVEQNVVWGKGAYRISSRELLLEVENSKKESKIHYKRKIYNSNRVDDQLSDDVRKTLEKWRRGQ
ncbi:hypothetical protein SAMN00017405_2337 [Desulfonispora thiosulfatigenes DSM 11270]|uniref:NYN domain-containing protein n=1 Tax=Desulfonispora thiosulfatigenes DSM 11270 TaxID=656914 RepID=A0A1W1UUK9_DESTI|nr:NYN domain-containing protein [Desulfonispora thiosulfatigenes]SMB84394.1 hypothetical protein SAMN00017405_2337 [Desulfonispora thiosulfatigenes DSM 11270]